MSAKGVARFAWALLGYTLLVIVWGVVVRATGSGAGCGSHWPTCNGVVLPTLARAETGIEFFHRLTSGAMGLVVLGLVAAAWRAFPRGHRVRRGALAVLGVTLLEGAIGAGLVRLELVGDNASPARAVWIALHLANTFLLLGVLTLTAWWASGGSGLRGHGQGRVAWLLGGGLVALLVVGMSGAVTALGDTLFPADSLGAGLRADFAGTAHFLQQLRVVHPLLAVAVGVYTLVAARLVRAWRPGPLVDRLATGLVAVFVVQLLAGALNVGLLAPLWMQIIHLLLADAVWILFVLLGAVALGGEAPARQRSAAEVTGGQPVRVS